jgi:Ran GTPase-activating protein (RanGAP) involved in mRNA processing and transport
MLHVCFALVVAVSVQVCTARICTSLPLSPDCTAIEIRNQGSKFGDAGAEAVGKALATFAEKVAVLDLRDDMITAVGADHIAKGIYAHKKLRRLDLRRNMIGDEGAKSVTAVLQKKRAACQENECDPDDMDRPMPGIKLDKLYLSHNRIGDDAVPFIGDDIARSASVVWLELGYNDFTKSVLPELLGYLAQNVALEFMGLYPHHKEDPKPVDKLSERNNQIRSGPHLDLEGMDMSDPIAAALSEALEETPFIQSVNFANTDITDHSVGGLARSLLLNNSAVTAVNFTGVALGPQSIKAISQVVGSGIEFTSLDLSSTGIDDKSIPHLVQAFEAPGGAASLHTLRLGNCTVSEGAGKKLLAAVTGAPALTDLTLGSYLWGGQMVDSVVKLLSPAVPSPRLKRFGLWMNDVNKNQAKVLSDALIKASTPEEPPKAQRRHNAAETTDRGSLQDMCLGVGKIDMPGIEELARVLRHSSFGTSTGKKGEVNSYSNDPEGVLESAVLVFRTPADAMQLQKVFSAHLEGPPINPEAAECWPGTGLGAGMASAVEHLQVLTYTCTL